MDKKFMEERKFVEINAPTCQKYQAILDNDCKFFYSVYLVLCIISFYRNEKPQLSCGRNDKRSARTNRRDSEEQIIEHGLQEGKAESVQGTATQILRSHELLGARVRVVHQRALLPLVGSIVE